jgi:hypothetical protein
MFSTVYDWEIREISAPRTDDKFVKIYCSGETTAYLALWLSAAQAATLRACLDKLYPPMLVCDTPEAAVDAYADAHAAAPQRKPEHSMDDPALPPLDIEALKVAHTAKVLDIVEKAVFGGAK